MSPDPWDEKVESAFQRHKQGDLRYANGVYRQALSQNPDHPAALHYLGLIAQQTGRSDEAATLIARSIAINPADPRAHIHLGQIQIALKDTAAATRSFERALELDPDNVGALNNLANVVRVRDLRQAVALYRRALALDPTAAFAAYNLAQALTEDNGADEAMALFHQVIALEPRHFEARHALGMLLEQRGKFFEAIEQYRAVQDVNPAHAPSLANLLDIRDYQPDDATVKRAEAILSRGSATVEDQIKLHHGLGKHYDRHGAYHKAFVHFATSKKRLRSQGLGFDSSVVAKSFDALIKAFDVQIFDHDRPIGSRSERPVFIVGLPRSGTTLTEQILSSHPQAFGAGELRKIPEFVKLLRPDYPEIMETIDGGELAELAADYLDHLDRLAGRDALRVSDKLPTNSLNLGLIARLFPNAKIVYCRRDPMDIALSCFMELFDLDQDYTTDFTDFGTYFLLHERLMAHWRRVLPIPIHELSYEEMVSSPEASTRALLDYCGLAWDPACLNFTSTDRTVRTPSRWQVRQPIYQRSVGRWRNYAEHLKGLERQLKEAGYAYAPTTAPQAAAILAGTQGSVEPAKAQRVKESKGLRRPIFIVAAPRSGSTLLFETLAASAHFSTLGGEAHWLVENIRALRPGAAGVGSNRLTAAHASTAVSHHIIKQIADNLVDSNQNPISADNNKIFLEKTPKNALRIPFFDSIFPDARFIFLWRDPRENISSIMEAWRSGRFVTYRRLAGFDAPWSLLLPPGYETVNNQSLEAIAAYQWDTVNRIILDDLEALDAQRWRAVNYAAFVADPKAEIQRLCAFAEIDPDPQLMARVAGPLPPSRYTETSPAADKWRRNEAAILAVLPQLAPTWARLRAQKP